MHSAGTHALVSEGMTEQALALALAHGADTTGAGERRARLLTEPLLAETDLVLTLARGHRSHVAQMMPALPHRTFTVREFASLSATPPTTMCTVASPRPGQRGRAAAGPLRSGPPLTEDVGPAEFAVRADRDPGGTGDPRRVHVSTAVAALRRRRPVLRVLPNLLLVPYALGVLIITLLPASQAGRVTGIADLLARLVDIQVPQVESYALLEFLANVALFVPLGLLLR